MFLSSSQRRAALAVVADELELAEAFASSRAGTPLRGVPYLLKDLFDVAGLPTFAGSLFLPEVRPKPESDSRIVKSLAAAGAVIAGKTQLFEFAWGLTGENAHYGDCEHPHFPGRTTGGSSSGSALAVAADIVPFAVGTDTGGSIRVPAAFCGIFGYRGTPGDALISDAVPLSPRFDTAGWFTRSAADMRSVMDALVGPPRRAPPPAAATSRCPTLSPRLPRRAARRLPGLHRPPTRPPVTGSWRDSLRRRRFTVSLPAPKPGGSTRNGRRGTARSTDRSSRTVSNGPGEFRRRRWRPWSRVSRP